MQKIYISGPITGWNIDGVRARFKAAAATLWMEGYDPVNPLENGLPEDAPYDEHMKRDLEMLAECDAIYMLTGWERSNGCRIEFEAAVKAGKRITYEKDNVK